MAIGSSWRRRGATAALATVVFLLLVGGWACSPGLKLTQENLDKVKDGMTTEQVQDLLGEPTAVNTVSLPVLGTVTTWEYKTEKADVELHFRDGVLKVKIGSIRQ
jgi:hypothetical protein